MMPKALESGRKRTGVCVCALWSEDVITPFCPMKMLSPALSIAGTSTQMNATDRDQTWKEKADPKTGTALEGE